MFWSQPSNLDFPNLPVAVTTARIMIKEGRQKPKNLPDKITTNFHTYGQENYHLQKGRRDKPNVEGSPKCSSCSTSASEKTTKMPFGK